MLGNRLKQMKQKVSQRALELKDTAQKKWEEMQEAPDNIPEHWEQHTDDNGNKFYIDTSNGEMYRMNKRQHKRIDTIEKISLVEQMSKSPSSPINETAQKQPWTCPSCTLENPGQATHCGACDTERPPEVEPETPSNLKSDKDKKLPAPSPSESKNQNEVSLNGGPKPDRPESASFDHKNDEDEKNEELSQNDTFIPQSQMNGSRQEQQHEAPRDNRNTENNMLDIPQQQQQGNNGNGSDDDYNDNGDADDPNGNEQSGHAQMSTMEQITAAIGDSLKSMGNADIDALNKDEQSVLLHFCELTDATPDAGLPFVQRAGWDIERAVALYFDEHPNPTKSRQASAALGVDDIARILNEDPIADDDDIFVSSDPNNNNKRGSIDLDADGVDGSQFVDPAEFNDVENEDGGHNRLTTKENIEVARIASLQQAQFDQESEALRVENDSLTVQNKDLLAQIEDLKQEKATLETELQEAKESAEFFEKKFEAERLLNGQHLEARQQFQKDWDRMNTTFDQIIEELSAIRRGDPNQTQFTKLGELIQQVENLRSPGNANVQGDGAEDGDQKTSSHQRQASRSYETFHKQKSSDPTYDRQKPAHTRSEHSRGPSFTLAKDIFNGAEDGNEDAEAGGDGNVEDGQVNNRPNNPNDSDDETGMRRDSIAKSENDEDMIAVIAYYDIGGGDDDDDDGIHSRDSSWFGDYGRLPTSRRVSQKTPQTVKDLFDSDSNTLQNMNSNGINGIVRAVAASANASNAGSSTGTPQNYSAMREIGHGKRTSSGRASRGVNIQPPIPEEVENNTTTERAHELLSKHEKEPSYSQDPNFKATNLTPISTDSNRPSRGQKLGDVFNDVGAPNFAELEKSHLTPVALVTGLHGMNDGPNEEKQRSKSDEEVEQEMRSKIRKEMEGEFVTREKELREQIRADITNELTPQIAQEARTEMETEFEDKLKQETDRLRTELQSSFEFQIKTMKQEMKDSEENHRIEVKSLENTKLDLIRSTSQEIESLREIIKKYFAKVNRKAAEVTANNQNSSNMIKSMFFK